MADVNESMTRDELDQIARDAGLNPDDYGNKAELVTAINVADGGDTDDQSPAVQTVPDEDANQTVEGGRYRDERGNLVNANGEPLKG